MAKYSFEFKKEIVMKYLNGEGGKKFLAKNQKDQISTRKIWSFYTYIVFSGISGINSHQAIM